MTLTGTAGYLETAAGPLFTVLHLPPDGGDRSGIVLAPPFGWEDVCSYRARRRWATELAAQGHAVLRLDLPGTGESFRVEDGDLLPSWVAALDAAAQALKQWSDCRRVTVLGLGLGGLATVAAVAAGAEIDDLVLWAVPARGRTAVRQLRAYSRLTVDSGAGGRDGELWVHGYCLPAPTVAALELLDLRQLTFAGPPGRALLLSQDGLSADPGLASALGSRFAVEAHKGAGWADMHAVPQARFPADVAAAVSRWLLQDTHVPGQRQYEHGPGASTTARLANGTSLQVTDLATRQGRLLAVLSRPAGHVTGELCAVLLNAGATRRTGPSGLWVEAAQVWADRGVPVVRVDLLGIGDSDGEHTWSGGDAAFYDDHYTEQVGAVLDALAEFELPARFVLIGLCSGAFWSFRAAQVDQRVVGAVLLNPKALLWHPRLVARRRSHELQKLRRASTWMRILAGNASFRHALDVVWSVVLRILQDIGPWFGRRLHLPDGPSQQDQLDAAFDRLRDNGVSVHLAFSTGEPLHRELVSSGLLDRTARWPNLHWHGLGGPPDAHTLGPPAVRRTTLELLQRAVEGLLGQTAGPAPELATPPPVGPRPARRSGDATSQAAQLFADSCRGQSREPAQAEQPTEPATTREG